MPHRFALAVVLTTCLGACSSSPPLPPPWPVSADVDLRAELEATREALAPRGTTSPDDSAVLDVPESPYVQALEGEAAGLGYVEVVLGEADLDASLPMVLMLHGRGDRPRVPGGPFACVPIPMRIIMPRGPDVLGPGYTWLSVRVAEGKTDEISTQLERRADQLAALLAEVAATRPTLGRPIVTGFSQGGLLTFALAVRHPGLVASAFPLAGWLPPPLWPSSAEGLPTMRAVHGTRDETIPVAPTRDAVGYLQALGADIELLEFEDVAHAMNGPMNAQFERWLEQALRRQAPTLADRPRDTSIELSDPAPGPSSRCDEASPTVRYTREAFLPPRT